jgi:BMFP domain-containing protein YqiC
MLADLPLPKDIISGLVQNAKGAKEDFTKSIREELRGHLSRLDMAKLVEEIVSRYDLEINASVKFKKKDQPPPDADA